MVCPNCGLQNDDQANVCIQCGTILNANMMPTTPQVPVTPNPMSQEITIPKDFVLAEGENGSYSNGLDSDLPTGVSTLLDGKENVPPPPSQKKGLSKQQIKTIIIAVVVVVVIAILIILGVVLLSEKEVDLTCTQTVHEDGMVTEYEYQYSNYGGYYFARNKAFVSHEDGSALTENDLHSLESQTGKFGSDPSFTLQDGKVFVTYTKIYTDVESVKELKAKNESNGATCK